MVKNIEEENIVLTEEDEFKCNVIKSAVAEEISTNDIVSGMLDQGFITAIWVLHRDGNITPDALDYALEHVPADLKDQLLLKISNPPKKRSLEKNILRLKADPPVKYPYPPVNSPENNWS